MNSWERDWFAIELFKMAKNWDNDDLRDKVWMHLSCEDIKELIKTIDKLAVEVNGLKQELASQQRSNGSRIRPPAERRDLDVNEMYAKYKELGSFSAVGKLMGCSHKTVKNRLKKAGLL